MRLDHEIRHARSNATLFRDRSVWNGGVCEFSLCRILACSTEPLPKFLRRLSPHKPADDGVTVYQVMPAQVATYRFRREQPNSCAIS